MNKNLTIPVASLVSLLVTILLIIFIRRGSKS